MTAILPWIEDMRQHVPAGRSNNSCFNAAYCPLAMAAKSKPTTAAARRGPKQGTQFITLPGSKFLDTRGRLQSGPTPAANIDIRRTVPMVTKAAI